MDIRKLIRPELVSMKGYTPIEPTEVLSRLTELPAGKIVKLDGNENPYGCSPKVYQALAAYPYYHNYPDPEQRELREALEGYSGLGRQHIVCGMGSDDLIDLILRLFLKPGDEVINCPPTFGMYPFSTDVCGGRQVDVPRTEDFALDMARIKKALTKRTKVIFVASPNNPTGNTTPEKEIIELVDTGKIVVIDEAYCEFSNVTVAKSVPSYLNLIVLRTFSKWAGLAGLRIGYGLDRRGVLVGQLVDDLVELLHLRVVDGGLGEVDLRLVDGVAADLVVLGEDLPLLHDVLRVGLHEGGELGGEFQIVGGVGVNSTNLGLALVRIESGLISGRGRGAPESSLTQGRSASGEGDSRETRSTAWTGSAAGIGRTSGVTGAVSWEVGINGWLAAARLACCGAWTGNGWETAASGQAKGSSLLWDAGWWSAGWISGVGGMRVWGTVKTWAGVGDRVY